MPKRLTRPDVGLKKRSSILKLLIGAARRDFARKSAAMKLLKGNPADTNIKKLNTASVKKQLKTKKKPGQMDFDARRAEEERKRKLAKALKEAGE